MKNTAFRIILLLSLPLLSIAQHNYKPGYIVTPKNDTLRGFIDYREWDNNPSVFSFKQNLSDNNDRTISVRNANEVGILHAEYYQKAKVKISGGSLDVASLSVGIDTSYNINTVFLKVIVNGKNAALYTYTDDVKKRFYIQDKKYREINELNYYAFFNNRGDADEQTETPFKLQLQIIAADYNLADVLERKINNAKYTLPDLREIVLLINGDENKQLVPEDLFASRFFLGGGVRLSNFNFDGTGGSAKGVNSTSIFPAISGGIDVILNKLTQKVMFRAELSLTHNQYSVSQYLGADNLSNLPSTGNLAFKQSSLTLTPQVIYNFYSKDDLKVFVGAGFNVNFSTYGTYQYIVNYGSFSTTVPNSFELRKLWASIPLRTGTIINKRFEVYAYYSLLASVANFGLGKANVTNYQVGLNYLFGM